MIYPGYLLNPGDMFQVEPDRVMFATGASKDARERRAGRKARQKSQASAAKSQDALPSDTNPAPTTEDPSLTSTADEPSSDSNKETLQSLLSQAKNLLTTPSSASKMSGKRKQDLRAFQRLLKRTLSRSRSQSIFPQKNTTLTDSLDAQLQELTQKLNLNPAPPADEEIDPRDPGPETLTSENSSLLRKALTEARENPIDVTKPYATPWRPRPYMSAFAFIPRYLEVHHRICSAVYLRHPVARPGLGEVPTPFGNDVNGLSFNWYLRRR